MVPVALMYYERNPIGLSTVDLPILTGLSITQIFLPNLLQNIGLEYTTASVSSVLQSTTPVFTLLLSLALLNERIGGRELVGLCVGMVGVLLLSTQGNFANLGGSTFFGNVLQVAVAASYAVSGIIGKVVLRKYRPILVVALTFLLGALILTGCALLFERDVWPSAISREVIVAMLLLSLLYCLGLVSWYDVLQRTGVFQLYVLLFTMPVLAIIISVIVLEETFTFNDILFSAMTLVGVAITQTGKR